VLAGAAAAVGVGDTAIGVAVAGGTVGRGDGVIEEMACAASCGSPPWQEPVRTPAASAPAVVRNLRREIV
jgi:hypothetical protein